MARAVERLVLVVRGVDEKSLLVPEAGHLALRAAYDSNLRGYRDGGPAGVQAIAHSMSLPSDTLEDDIEPFLLRSGLIKRTPRGRVVNDAAYEHLGRRVSRWKH